MRGLVFLVIVAFLAIVSGNHGNGNGNGNGNNDALDESNFVGCWRDDESHTMQVMEDEDDENMTNERCVKLCEEKKEYKFAATQNGKKCFCARTEGEFEIFSRATNCNQPCSGNKDENCGGRFANRVYRIED